MHSVSARDKPSFRKCKILIRVGSMGFLRQVDGYRFDVDGHALGCHKDGNYWYVDCPKTGKWIVREHTRTRAVEAFERKKDVYFAGFERPSFKEAEVEFGELYEDWVKGAE